MIMISTDKVKQIMASAVATYIVVACVALAISNSALLG